MIPIARYGVVVGQIQGRPCPVTRVDYIENVRVVSWKEVELALESADRHLILRLIGDLP